MSGVLLFKVVPRRIPVSEMSCETVGKSGKSSQVCYWTFISAIFFPEHGLKPSPVLTPSAVGPPQRPARMLAAGCLSLLSECR